jgi:calcium-dependent protein kinase
MFGKCGEIKFIDFGFAVVQNQRKSKMEVAGTPYYVAPEVLSGCYGKECDIWSLGVSFYQMLSGEVPFDGNSQEEVFDKIKDGKYKKIANISEKCHDLLDRMIQVDVQ